MIKAKGIGIDPVPFPLPVGGNRREVKNCEYPNGQAPGPAGQDAAEAAQGGNGRQKDQEADCRSSAQ